MAADVDVLREIQTGWWEDVLLVRVDGEPRVRKVLHRLDAPWAREVFVKEWRYLRGLPDAVSPWFVRVLDECEALRATPIRTDRRLWFDMEPLEGFTDVRTLLAEGRFSALEAEQVDRLLVDALVHGLYRLPGEPFEPEQIVWPVMQQVLRIAMDDPDLARFARAERIVVNGRSLANLQHVLPMVWGDARPTAQLRDAESVRLHGDLFYENVMFRPDPPAVRLVDPVSVAGVEAGPIVFDRVKFASWTGGELYALRHGAFGLTGDAEGATPSVDYAWSREDPVIANLDRIRPGGTLLEAMDTLTGPCEEARAVLDAYFALAMAANTPMPQKLLRYARSVERLAAWAE